MVSATAIYGILTQMRLQMILLAFLSAVGSSYAQSCPVQNSQGVGQALEASVLHGKLLYHEELRPWLGLQLDRPSCDENEVQFVFSDTADWRRAKSLRSCTVTASGKLYVSPTSYYEKNMAISDPTVTPDKSCQPSPAEGDFSAVPIPQELRTYRVSIKVDYR